MAQRSIALSSFCHPKLTAWDQVVSDSKFQLTTSTLHASHWNVSGKLSLLVSLPGDYHAIASCFIKQLRGDQGMKLVHSNIGFFKIVKHTTLILP